MIVRRIGALMNGTKAKLGLLAALLSIAGASEAKAIDPDHLRALPKSDGPLQVQIGFHVFDITDISEKDETIDFDGAIYLQWHDPRQAYDPADFGYSAEDFPSGDTSRSPPRLYQGEFAVKEVFQGWRPHIKFANAIGDRQTTYMAIVVWPDGTVVYADHFLAKAETPMNLRRFPFDRQSLELYLVPHWHQAHEVELVHADGMSGTWQQDSGIAEWEKLGLKLEEQAFEYVHRDGVKKVVSQLLVKLDVARRPGHVLFSIIFPLLILVSLTWIVFWLDEESVTDRVNISFIGILSVVAYYLVMQDSVPEIPYLTMVDAFILATFLILAATVVINIVVDKYNRSGRKAEGDRLDRICRWGFPLGYVFVTALIAFVFSMLG
ncbi:MAG: hypothetical protein JRH14_06825 [Deltaproteobacteria bacterium]|nr:hypothetical protein [Deltaproteobacteria bacterium]MBW2381404.1 hypothetical protein [Deltaproteobacteria bacterium]